MDMMLEQFKTIFDRPEKVKRLRETILDLAVRGKLVKQDPNDEPASVLLERIKEEKERLVKEGKIKREKSLPEIREDEKPYELPKGWEWSRFSNCVRNIKGVTYKKNVAINEEKEEYELILRGGNIDSKTGSLMYSDNIYIPKGIIKDDQYIISGDTLMVASSGTKSSIAKSTFILNKIHNTSVGAFLYIIRPHPSINSRYVNILVQKFRQNIIDTTAGTNISNVNKGELDQFLTPVPPLEEQKRISERVDFLMTFCDKLEKALEKKVHYGELSAKSIFNAIGNVSTTKELEETLRFILLNFKDLSLGDNAVKELKNCILQLAVQGKLVPQDPNDEPAEVLLEKIKEEKERLIKEGKIKKEKPLWEISEDEKPFELPKGWKWVRLGEVINLVSGQHIVNTDYNEVKDGIPYLTGPTDFGEEYTIITKWTNKPKVIVQKDNILITVKGSGVGKLNILSEDASIGRQLMSIQPISTNEKYIRYILMSNKQVFQAKKIGIAIPGISREDVLNLQVALPPLEEEKRIVEKVDSLMVLCDELEKKIEKQKSYSNRLMESILKDSFKA